jgi:hypothetical protein
LDDHSVGQNFSVRQIVHVIIPSICGFHCGRVGSFSSRHTAPVTPFRDCSDMLRPPARLTDLDRLRILILSRRYMPPPRRPGAGVDPSMLGGADKFAQPNKAVLREICDWNWKRSSSHGDHQNQRVRKRLVNEREALVGRSFYQPRSRSVRRSGVSLGGICLPPA